MPLHYTGGGNRIVIGNNCNLNGTQFYINSDNNQIIISDNVTINASKKNPTCLNACDGKMIKIGNYSLLSNNIEIHTTDYHKIIDRTGLIENAPKDVIIGNHVWIGLQSLILKGTRIADNCIIGARSLLSKSYSTKGSVIVGHPAKEIKNEIKWVK